MGKFVEEMSEAEKQKAFAELPPGLHNLGNTCYLNACLQCMKSVNELREYLKKYASEHLDTNSVAAKLGALMNQLDSNSDAVIPQQFVQYFRGAFPRFASRNEQGVWEQEEAESKATEKFIKLQCFIDIDSRHINDGIKKGF